MAVGSYMAVEEITLKSIARLEKGQTLWDEAVKGFGIRRQSRTPVYVFKYRDKNGRQRFLTIGRHGSPWMPETARAEAKQYLAMVAARQGFAGSQTPQPASSPFLSEFAEIYVNRYASLHKKPRSVAEDRRNLDLHILPLLGTKRLTELTNEDVARFHAERSEYPANANRCLALLSHIFTVAAQWGLAPAGFNPCRGVRRFRESTRERFLSSDEIVRLGRTLAMTEGSAHASRSNQEDWRTVNILKLLIYTGARLSEILTLQWTWIHWDAGFARLPDSKTGSKNVPLPQPALELLDTISDRHGRKSKFVFPGKHHDAHFTGIQKSWQRIRKEAGLPDVHIHDLRHCYAAAAVAGGESLFLVGAVLGHRAPSTTQRYAHLAMPPILDSANRTAGRLAALMSAGRHDRDRNKDSL